MFTLGAEYGFPLGTNVNTPFFPSVRDRARLHGLDLVLRHLLILEYLANPVSERNTILCRCPGISARAPSVYIALVSVVEVSLNFWQIPLGVSSPRYTIITESERRKPLH